ncbi:MAG: glycosyltransferase [Candidatus Omnitrophota bacterium]
MAQNELANHFDKVSHKRNKWCKRNSFYHNKIIRLFSKFVPYGKNVLEIGCATGNLLAGLKPSKGTGIDISKGMVEIAKEKYPHLDFRLGDAQCLDMNEKFDYVVICDTIGLFSDIWMALREIKKVSYGHTRVVISVYNILWYLPLLFLEFLGLKMEDKQNSWLSVGDIRNFLNLAGYEIEESGFHLPVPFLLLPFSGKIDDFISRLPFIKRLGSITYAVARPIFDTATKDIPCSVIIPCRNEAGNIEPCVRRMPQISSLTELIFVDGGSTDGTVDEIKRMQDLYKDEKLITLIHQNPAPGDTCPDKMLKAGKGDAVRLGFDTAGGDILMILDSDLTVAPEDLDKFYCALAEGRADFVNGSRMVYPQEKGAMRFLNYLGNKFFSMVFTWLIGQRVSDTLCGTKCLFKGQYQKMKENRAYFGDFDPFGDFDLLFGASRLSLKIIDIPIRYHKRTYGEIKIERFKHGLLLLKMSLIGFRKLKLRI